MTAMTSAAMAMVRVFTASSVGETLIGDHGMPRP